APCRKMAAGSGTDPDTDFLTALEDQELLSTRPAPPPLKEQVIPLVPPHSWRNPERPCTDIRPTPATDDTPSTDPPPARAVPGPSSVEAQVMQELLQEVQQNQEQPEGGLGLPIAIPLQLPDKDVATGLLPTPQNYEAVPVGLFRLAMLWGTGWSQGQGIGHTF
ncbi:GPKOW protein, partial [Drymodes brunneopygia]|nr:GPKOW protein [Drymodes brunneopygia]